MKKFYLLVLLSVLFSTAVFAQRTITGTVTGGGEPVIGGAVKVVGATVATVTDFDGKYTIKVPTNYTTLEFSYLGYKTVQKVLDASNVVDVDLEEDAIGLDEVVVTALNIPRKEKTVGYATQDLDGGAFTKAREANVVNSLSGKVAGVNITNSSGAVGASTRITLRGAMSITGSNEPLFVVDGVPIDNKNYGTAGDGGGFDMPNGIADLNPDDIASISVLKGPAASALYGSRGGNGAILITTKKGSGLGKRGFGVSLNSSTTFENPLVLPNFQNSYGQGPDDEYFYWENGSTDDGGVDESWGPPLDVGLEFTQWNSQLNDGKPLPWISVPNNIRDFYDTGMTTSNSIGFTGNNDLISYRLSLGAMNQKGIVPNTDYNRYNVGGNTDFNISSKIKAGISVNYSKALSNNLPTGGYDNENPVQQMIWSGRNVDFSLLEDYENLPLAPVGTAAEGTPLNWNNVFQNNPYWVLHTNLNQLDKDRLIGNVYASWSITKNLTLTAKTGADHWSSLVTERKAIGSNEFQNGYYREIGRRFTERNSDFLLTYKRDVSPDFSFTLSGGGNAMKTNYRFLSGEAPQLELPNLYNLQNIKAGSTPVLINEVQEFAINSLYGLAQLGFRDAIFLDLTGRNDWASVAALDNNSFFYPSAALSVIWTDLFEMDKKTFSFFKTRVSWARTGSMGPLTAYDTQQVYDFRDASFGTLPLAYDPDLLKNPNITPEFTNAFEAGFDVRLLQNKIRLDFTYYNQGGRDLIVPVEVSAASGYIKAYQNIADINNKGVEIKLGLTPVKNDDFTWDINLNWAKNTSEVVSLGDAESLILGGQWNMTLEARKGQPYGVIVGSYFARDENGNIIHADGLPQQAEGTKVLGNIQPKFTGGLGMDFRYKQISAGFLIDGKIGGSIYSMTNAWGRYSGVLAETIIGREGGIVGDGVMNVGTSDSPNYAPNNVVVTAESYNKAAYGNDIVEGSVFDASFIKLRQIVVGYQLPDKWFNKNIFNGASISLVGRNLAFLHRNAPHIDPETGFSSKIAEQGQEFGQLPSTRSIGFNLNFNF